MRAIYHYADDRLYWWPGRELSPTEYAAARTAGFRLWPERQAWVARWSAAAEAYLLTVGVSEIGEDRRFPEGGNVGQIRATIVQHQLQAEGNRERDREHAERRNAWLRERLAALPLPPFGMKPRRNG